MEEKTVEQIAAEQAEAQRVAREDSAINAAAQNATMVAAAGITNGMPWAEQRRRLLAVAAPAGVQ